MHLDLVVAIKLVEPRDYTEVLSLLIIGFMRVTFRKIIRLVVHNERIVYALAADVRRVCT